MRMHGKGTAHCVTLDERVNVCIEQVARWHLPMYASSAGVL